MKFFVPELHVKLNDPDAEVGDRAQAEIERVGERYEKHFKRIRSQLPESACRFHDECNLHDAEVFGPARLSLQTIPWGFHDVVIVVQNVNTLYAEHLNTLMFLQYAAVAEPSLTASRPSGVFHPNQPHCLYDEFDLVEPGIFSHELLLSDGRVISTQFRQFQYHIAPLVMAAANGKAASKPKKKAVPA